MLITMCMRKKMLKVADSVEMDRVNKYQKVMIDIVHKSRKKNYQKLINLNTTIYCTIHN